MKSNDHDKKSALSETNNPNSSANIGKNAADKIKALRRKKIDTQNLIDEIIKGNHTALSRAITLVESEQPNHQAQAKQVIDGCLPHANNSLRIGITGVPGVGKSTFIEAFGNYLINEHQKKVAVLAIDPTSSVSHGSILGDKTRMEELVKQKHAFIRPTASGDSLGGVAKKTRESVILCEAAGYDIILIETVGVGQSETMVHSMTDFFLLLKLAGAGDELQGIKRGIIEMADAIVINKADGENKLPAKKAKTEFTRALHLYPQKPSAWQPKVVLASALKNTGIDKVWQLVTNFEKQTKKNNYFQEHRNEQNKFWLIQTINEHLKSSFYHHPTIKKELQRQLQLIEENKTTPFEAASYLLNLK